MTARILPERFNMTPTFALFDSLRWWSGLTGPQQLFYGIGIVAGIVTLIMAVLGLAGLGHHDATDAVDHFDGGSLLSTKPITGFFLGFGWAGGIALEGGLSVPAALAIALVSGGIVMVGIAAMLRGIYSLRSDGTRKIDDAIGAVGTVYVTLPPARASGGQISVTVSGRLETVPALNSALRSIPSGEKVKVVGVVDANTVLVEPMG
jgi:membrane protein implicated in regulation of membrane protease activity